MGQPFTCDNGDGTLAFVVMTAPETGDTNALCAECLLEWCYGVLVGSERGTELLRDRMLEMAAQAKAAAPAKAGQGRAPAKTADQTVKDTDPEQAGESTPGQAAGA